MRRIAQSIFKERRRNVKIRTAPGAKSVRPPSMFAHSQCEKFSSTFFKRWRSGGCVSLLDLRRGRNPPNGVFFVNFLLRLRCQKKVAKGFCLFKGGRPNTTQAWRSPLPCSPLTHLRWELPPRGAFRKKMPVGEKFNPHKRAIHEAPRDCRQNDRASSV